MRGIWRTRYTYHFIVECSRYEREREILIERIVEVVGREEWNQIIQGEDGGLLLVAGLERNNDIRILEATKEFLECAWRRRE